MSQVSYEVRDGVAVLTLENPPVNGLGHELRRRLVEGLDRAAGDPTAKAVVLVGAGKAFSGGADIKEFESPKALAEPNLHTVIRVVEQSPKPVVAAIHAVCMGGGLELALACHYRVAAAGAQIALPEVKLGLLPGAGGTQRLPRAVGLETALNMIVSGTPVPAEMLARSGLFDQMIEGELLAGAVAFASGIAEKRPLPLLRDRKVEQKGAEGYLAFARNTAAAVAKDYPAPHKCIDAVEAAVEKPFEEGLRVEGELFVQLMFTPESRALRHAFFAERAASKIPDVPEDTPTRPVKLAAVIGAGTMGGGIAMNFANAGIPVKVLEVKQEALDRGLSVIRKNYEGSAKKGKLTAEQVGERLGRIQPTLDYAALGDADIVVEAVFEDLAVKEQVFKKLDEVMKPGAILASNTSTLDVDKIASFTKRPQDVIGTHFFSPANVMRLLEIVRGAKTGKDVLATVMALSKKMKKTGVVSAVCDGFIGNRMVEQYLRQCLFLLEEGALPQQVDRALEKWGWVMGPFRMSDLAGNDVGWYIRKRRYVERPDFKYSRVADEICEQGRFGQKTGAGWYRYETGKRDAIPDPAVEATIVAYRQKIGLAPRKISDDEIVHRCAWALTNEAALLLEEGIAQRASDVDMVYLTGYGFPVFRGGPMRYADEVGLYNVVRAMKRFAENRHGDPGFWKPAPLLARLAAEGKSFTGKGE